jgi:hypothetical protein
VIQNPLDNQDVPGSYGEMSSESKKAKVQRKSSGPDRKPVWAEGLKRMYDSVVDEKIPDDFADLLKKLDDAGDSR